MEVNETPEVKNSIGEESIPTNSTASISPGREKMTLQEKPSPVTDGVGSHNTSIDHVTSAGAGNSLPNVSGEEHADVNPIPEVFGSKQQNESLAGFPDDKASELSMCRAEKRKVNEEVTKENTTPGKRGRFSGCNTSPSTSLAFDVPGTSSSGSDAGSILASNNERITLRVGNTRFIVNPSFFTSHPDTMLGRMFGSGIEFTRTNERGEYEVADGIPATIFRVIMEYYKGGTIRCPPTVSIHELRKACDYLLIPFNVQTVKCQNMSGLLHELSNDGARRQFEILFEEFVLPVTVNCAGCGERECYIIILLNDEVVKLFDEELEWDDILCPQRGLGNSSSKTINSTALYKFLKYIGNRVVAYEVMKEKGFKNIGMGIEMVSKRPGGRSNERYKDALRPHIQLSWDIDEEDMASFVQNSCKQ